MDKGYRILLHSEKSLASIETVASKTLRDGWDTTHPATVTGSHTQSEKSGREKKRLINTLSKDSGSTQAIAEDSSSSLLRLVKNPVTGKLTLMCHSAIGVNKENNESESIDAEEGKRTSDLVTSSTHDSQGHYTPTTGSHKRQRGRPRKERGQQVKEEEYHTCTRVIKTNTRTVYLKGECNCFEKQSEHKKTEVKVELEHDPSHIGDEGKGVQQNNEEGNLDIKEYVTASMRIRDQYKPWRKNYNVVDGKEALPEYKIQAMERTKRQKEMRQSQRYSVFHSWSSILACKDRVEEETRSKYNLYSKTPGFGDDKPKPGKKVLFELKRSKGDSAVVPYTGVPLMWIGSRVYACHLSKHASKYGTKRIKGETEDNYSAKCKQKRITPSKHIGCPATFSVTKVARFPDFEVTDDSKCKTTVSAELRKAWLEHPEKVRFYIEYYVKRPRIEDHQGHFTDDKKISSKFQEPIDPRILQKIYDLTKDGIVGVKEIKDILAIFVRKELFKNSEPPSPNRRRYNPSSQDIRNAMKKARLELQRAGKSVLQIQCNKLIRDISDLTNSVSSEEYLSQLRDHLIHLQSTIRERAPLEPFLACMANSKQHLPGSSKKVKVNPNTQDFAVPDVKERTPHYSYTVSETEQATQVLYQEELQRDQEMKLDEGVTQIYYYHQIAPGEEVYATEVVDSAMQQ